MGKLHDLAGKGPHSPRVGVMTLPPIQRGTAVWERARLSVNGCLRRACGASGPVSLPQNQRQFLVDLESVDAALSSDGVHFTANGYREFARRAFAAIRATAPELGAPPLVKAN